MLNITNETSEVEAGRVQESHILFGDKILRQLVPFLNSNFSTCTAGWF